MFSGLTHHLSNIINKYQSARHSVSESFSWWVIQLVSHSASEVTHLVSGAIRSASHSVSESFSQRDIQSVSHSVGESFSQWVIQSVSYSVSESFSQWVTHAVCYSHCVLVVDRVPVDYKEIFVFGQKEINFYKSQNMHKIISTARQTTRSFLTRSYMKKSPVHSLAYILGCQLISKHTHIYVNIHIFRLDGVEGNTTMQEWLWVTAHLCCWPARCDANIIT